jgi:hypothetical protein
LWWLNFFGDDDCSPGFLGDNICRLELEAIETCDKTDELFVPSSNEELSVVSPVWSPA